MTPRFPLAVQEFGAGCRDLDIAHCLAKPRHRFPAEIIAHAAGLSHRFRLSLRDVEDPMAERGIDVPPQTVSGPRDSGANLPTIVADDREGNVPTNGILTRWL